MDIAGSVNKVFDTAEKYAAPGAALLYVVNNMTTIESDITQIMSGSIHVPNWSGILSSISSDSSIRTGVIAYLAALIFDGIAGPKIDRLMGAVKKFSLTWIEASVLQYVVYNSTHSGGMLGGSSLGSPNINVTAGSSRSYLIGY